MVVQWKRQRPTSQRHETHRHGGFYSYHGGITTALYGYTGVESAAKGRALHGVYIATQCKQVVISAASLIITLQCVFYRAARQLVVN
jgi:hypothetical protein